MNLLTNSVALLGAGLQQVGGELVTYRRATQAIEELTAVPVATRHDDYGGEEMSLTAREKDWIIAAADLVLDGVVITPERGDQLDWLDAAGAKHTYDVLPRADDRCYRESDPAAVLLRVYTVETRPSADT